MIYRYHNGILTACSSFTCENPPGQECVRQDWLKLHGVLYCLMPGVRDSLAHSPLTRQEEMLIWCRNEQCDMSYIFEHFQQTLNSDTVAWRGGTIKNNESIKEIILKTTNTIVNIQTVVDNNISNGINKDLIAIILENVNDDTSDTVTVNNNKIAV